MSPVLARSDRFVGWRSRAMREDPASPLSERSSRRSARRSLRTDKWLRVLSAGDSCLEIPAWPVTWCFVEAKQDGRRVTGGEGKDAGQDQDPIKDLITTFYELNGSTIEELGEEPSPLEFMRYVARNTPFVVRGGARDWVATRTWNPTVLEQEMGGQEVNIAVTPMGDADSPTLDDEGNVVFVKPWEEDQEFSEFLRYVIRQEKEGTEATKGEEIRYAQTQNDNLRNEYATLFSHVQKSIPFARIALQKEPEAINLWIGNSRSVTALHKDNYENVYVQVLGRKHFVLMPGLCQPCVGERGLRPATYARSGGNRRRGKGEGNQGERERELVMEYDGDGHEDGEGGRVPFATWDPDRPEESATRYSELARPMRVTLEPGDMMYLPAMW
ncbi:uncharacterized protein MKZ38_005893 [Zalerion maritima]|uniref:JmjC domain-containing protein n=1 Tax=Zalerion maritima TaxID=339359 RepID=A0AAD5WNQ9_9PEZI|nr:uncharacterized protein MKZ38_005893 [Zalerion maritima]